jgi:hypothetical protein
MLPSIRQIDDRPPAATYGRRMTSRIAIIAALAAAALSLAACGGSDDDAPTAGTPTVAATGAASSAPAAGGSGCGAVGEDIKSVIAAPEVDTVEVVGQCTTVAIKTRLADGDAAKAKEICTAAAKVAYTGDVNSIRVTSANGTELSQGIAGAPCL